MFAMCCKQESVESELRQHGMESTDSICLRIWKDNFYLSCVIETACIVQFAMVWIYSENINRIYNFL